MKVVIVDDSVYSIALISLVVKKQGHEVVGEAKNGQEAIQMIKELNPDVVTLDNMLSDMDGIDIILNLKGEFDPNKIIVISGSNDLATQRKYKRTGVKEILEKPFETFELENAMERMLVKL